MGDGAATPSPMLTTTIQEIIMADMPLNTLPAAAAPINFMTAPDQLAFRNALDLFFEALRADWVVHKERADLSTPSGQKLGHAAATAWTSCVEALNLVRNLPGAHVSLREAANHFLQTEPGHFPDELDLMDQVIAVSKLAKQQKAQLGLEKLLTEAVHLLEVYQGNLALMGLRPAA